MKLGRIDPREYKIKLPASPNGEGNDSNVYFGSSDEGIIVLKVYNPSRVNGNVLQRYTDLTNNASGLFRDRAIGQHIVSVNPVLRIGTVAGSHFNDRACSVSPRIMGQHYNGYRDDDFLVSLSILLNEELGSSAIHLVPVNLKVEGQRLIVTDLCGWISLPRYNKKQR